MVERDAALGETHETNEPSVDCRSCRRWMRRSSNSSPRPGSSTTAGWLGGDAQSSYRGLQGRECAALSRYERRYSAGVPSDQHRQSDTCMQGRRREGCKGSFKPLVDRALKTTSAQDQPVCVRHEVAGYASRKPTFQIASKRTCADGAWVWSTCARERHGF